ncbi:MAG: HD domain-containing protein, partial [Zoogloeaceae bacterium]|nr:HD domain-containing protein [Zoogloeaceae bacterium]
RLHVDGATVVYTGDHEIDRESDPACVRERQWLTGADIAIVDATYNRADYQRGWGHSTWEDWLDVALESGLPRLILSHHLPTRTDADLDQLAEALKARTEGTGLSVHVGIEQAIFSPQGMLSPRITAVSHWLSSFMEETAHLNDTSAALDAILGKSRQVSRADAGTIFLVEGQQLVFSYTHNDTLFPGNAASKFAYLAMALPISEESIAGYAALSGRTLEIPDVFDLPPGAPYHFNDSFDKRTGYATCSILAVPFFGSNGKVLGVMQLINSIDPLTGKPTSFQSGDIANVEALAREAASLIERAQLQRRGIYNVLQMAELHDPAETGAHAERVGAVSAELYQRWAERHGVQSEFLRYSKGCIRLAAMLHDIGKVGISERILKKPGKLNTEEFLIMRQHTRLGAQVLADDTADLAALTRDIARHHHQKWNGQGYADESEEGRLSGEDIPLAARIVSIADVFDALVSPRCYKAPWSFEDSLLYLVDRASEDFDPELVSCWQEILDVVKEIYQRYPERKVKEKAFA